MNRSEENQYRIEPYIGGIVLGACVFFAGFVMLNIMWMHWKAANPDSSLPGLYYYKAATIGDGLCLPLLVFSLSCYSFLNRIESYETRKKARRRSCLIGVASAIVGLVIQVSWLLREGGGHNWTIPEDHHFNYAGWYHAFFFVCMFGVIAFFLAETFQNRKYGVSDLSRVDHLLFGILSFSSAYYIMLQRLDDMSDNYSDTSIIIGSGIVVFLMISLLIFFSKKNGSMILIGFCFSSIVSAAGMAFLSKQHSFDNIVYPICIFFVSFTFLETENEEKWASIRTVIEQLLYISIPVLIINTVYLSCVNENKFSIFVALCVFLIPALNYVLLTKKYNRRRMPILSFLTEHILTISLQLIILTVIILLSNHLILNQDRLYIFDLFLSALVFLLGFKSISQIFNSLIEEEKRVINGEKSKKFLSNSRMYTYGKIILITVGLIIYLICAPSGVIHVTSLIHIINVLPDTRRRIAICLFLIATALLLLYLDIILEIGLFHRNKKNENKVCWGSSVLFGIVYLLSVYCMYLVNKPYEIKLDVVHICSIFQIIGCSALVAESYYSNIYCIRDVDNKKDYILNSIIILLGSMMFLVFSIVPSYGPTFCLGEGVFNVEAMIIGIVGNTLILVVYPYLLFFSTCVTCFKSDHYLEGPQGEVAKNGFLAVMIAFAAGAMPVYISIANMATIRTSLAVLGLILYLYCWVEYCTENNVNHLIDVEMKAIEKIEKSEEKYDYEKKRLTALQNHLQRQNLISLFSLLLYCIIPITKIIITNMPVYSKDEDFDKYLISLKKSMKKSLKEKYFPELIYFKNND